MLAAFRDGTDISLIAARYDVQSQTVRSYLVDRGALDAANAEESVDAV